MRWNFEHRESRPCDLEVLQELKDHLKVVRYHLAAKIRNLTEYRTLMIEQDKTYNVPFGQNRSVGLLSFVGTDPAKAGSHRQRLSTGA
jgi:hypothetical protein